MMDMVEASILDTLANYDESNMKAIDKHGTGLNIKVSLTDGKSANLLRDGKFSLSASITLKVWDSELTIESVNYLIYSFD